MNAGGVEVEITYKYHPQGREHFIGTAFTYAEIETYMQEFECGEEDALRGLSEMYLFENKKDAMLVNVRRR